MTNSVNATSSLNQQAPAQLAFLGMGLMGSRMALRWLQAGYPVSVWNRTPIACEPLLAAGAFGISAPEQLAECTVIALCLADDAAVEAVADWVIPGLLAGQVVVDFSSSSVELTQRLALAAQRQQAYWIDCPVSGGVMGAEHGTLVMFAGGPEAIVETLQPVLAPLSQRVTHMGPSGAGQATKICNQLIVAANSVIIAEAVALAEQSGVDSRLLAPALAGGFADSKPFQILTPRMAARDFEPVQWRVKTLAKDLGLADALAKQYGLSPLVACHAKAQLEAYCQSGHADDDLSSIIGLYAASSP